MAAVSRHHVVALVAEGVTPFELGVTAEVFGYDRPELHDPWYRFTLAADRPGAVQTDLGFSIGVEAGLDAVRRADTVIVVPNNERGVSDDLLDAVRRAHVRGARIVSLCTGAFTLAAAGLLDGGRATTHWRRAAELASRFPQVDIDPNVLFVESDGVWTSAGSAASLDLCLHLVRCDLGAEVATALARRLVVPPQRDGGQAQFLDDPVLVMPGADLFAETLEWMEEHLHEPVSVADLAARSAMSPRTFARRFRQSTGTTPHQWLLRQRINLARRLLETTDEPIEVVADRCGFGTAANLRLHFRRIVRTTPQAYRATFCCREVSA